MSLICLRDACVLYGKKENMVKALDHVSMEIQKGEFVVITGKSGCGKTTLLNIIGGIKNPTSGQYFYNDEDVSSMTNQQAAIFRNRNIGFVVQHFALIPDRTVSQNIEIPLLYRKESKQKRKNKIQEVVELLGIADKINRFPYELSGGQKQRVAIARSIVTQPDIIIADEPTGALDEETGENIMELLKQIHEKGTTVIMVTHNMEYAKLGDRCLTMRDGKIL